MAEAHVIRQQNEMDGLRKQFDATIAADVFRNDSDSLCVALSSSVILTFQLFTF